jgi:hypothetical protein
VLLLLALSLASAASSPVTLERALRNTTPTFDAPMQDDGRQYDNPCFAGKFSILKSSVLLFLLHNYIMHDCLFFRIGWL